VQIAAGVEGDAVIEVKLFAVSTLSRIVVSDGSETDTSERSTSSVKYKRANGLRRMGHVIVAGFEMTDDLKQIARETAGSGGLSPSCRCSGLRSTGFGLMALIMGIKGMQTAQKNAWVGVFVGGLFTLVGIGFDAGIVALFRVRSAKRRWARSFRVSRG